MLFPILVVKCPRPFWGSARWFMPQDTDLIALLSQHYMRFYWNESLGFWWLEAQTFSGGHWHSAYFEAAEESQARAAALKFLKQFSSCEGP